jgi:hypothetical protein
MSGPCSLSAEVSGMVVRWASAFCMSVYLRPFILGVNLFKQINIKGVSIIFFEPHQSISGAYRSYVRISSA